MSDIKSLRKINQIVTTLNYVRNKGRVWRKSPEGKWSTRRYDEEKWLKQFSEEMKLTILSIAGSVIQRKINS